MKGSVERQSICEPIRTLRASGGLGKGIKLFVVSAADCAYDADCFQSVRWISWCVCVCLDFSASTTRENRTFELSRKFAKKACSGSPRLDAYRYFTEGAIGTILHIFSVAGTRPGQIMAACLLYPKVAHGTFQPRLSTEMLSNCFAHEPSDASPIAWLLLAHACATA